MAAYRYFNDEWQTSDKYWHCGNTADLGNGSNEWWKLPRLLCMPLEDYVKLVVVTYKPDKVWYHQDSNVLSFSWKSITAMRKFKNDMNKRVRNLM